MKIVATTEFLRGRVRLMPGAGYEVSERHGWQLIGFAAAREATAADLIAFTPVEDGELGSDAPAPAAENITLTVHDSIFGVDLSKPEL